MLYCSWLLSAATQESISAAGLVKIDKSEHNQVLGNNLEDVEITQMSSNEMNVATKLLI